MDDSKQQIREILERDRLQNALLIRALNVTPDARTYLQGESVAVQEAEGGIWLFSLKDEGDFAALVKKIGPDLSYTFFLADADHFDEVHRVLPHSVGVQYVQYAIDAPTFSTVPLIPGEGLEFVPMDHSWMDYILSIYQSQEFANADYVGKCLDCNPAYGALYHGEKVGFIMCHLDGEVGTIVVSEKARGKGLGRLLMQAITPDYIAKGGIGSGMVLPENEFCNRMLRGSNYVATPKHIMWAYIEIKDTPDDVRSKADPVEEVTEA